MTAIAGASAGVKDMADGSLRITIEFEPKDAKNAFELFGSRGTPIAVAALKVGYAAVPGSDDEQPVQQPRKDTRGPYCREACDYCADPAFQSWVRVDSEALAKAYILRVCGINSRKELDSNPQAADLFKAKVRVPFLRAMRQAA